MPATAWVRYGRVSSTLVGMSGVQCYTARVMSTHRSRALIVAWFAVLGLWLWCPGPASAQFVDIFRDFTNHIERQIKQDKQYFVDAQTCTEWFYKQQKKPDRPQAE